MEASGQSLTCVKRALSFAPETVRIRPQPAYSPMPVQKIARIADRTGDDRFACWSAGQEGRGEVESFIADAFLRHYDARISSFMPELVTLKRNERMEAASGYRAAADGPLFLEQYLNYPIETCISDMAGRDVSRNGIIEVGQMAANQPGAGTSLMLRLARFLASEGNDWMAFTATAELRDIIIRLGVPLITLAEADPARLGAGAAIWGRYYAHRPLVVCASLETAARRLAQAANLEIRA